MDRGRAPAGGVELGFDLADGIEIRDAMTMFAQHRREKKNPFTVIGWNMALKRAREIPVGQLRDAVEHSIASGWTSINPRTEKAATIKHERNDSLNLPDRYK